MLEYYFCNMLQCTPFLQGSTGTFKVCIKSFVKIIWNMDHGTVIKRNNRTLKEAHQNKMILATMKEASKL